MADVDSWLADAARVTRDGTSDFDLDSLHRRLHFSPAPALALARHDARLAMVCAAFAALLGFAAMETVALQALDRPAATWLAMPPAASPFGLLVGR